MAAIKQNARVKTPDGYGRIVSVRPDGKCAVALEKIPETGRKDLQSLGLISNIKFIDAEKIEELKL